MINYLQSNFVAVTKRAQKEIEKIENGGRQVYF